MHDGVGGGGVGPAHRASAALDASGHPSSLSLATQAIKTLRIRRHPTAGLGFSFSTHTENYLDGINHYVTSVADGGSAFGAGLKVGARLLTISGANAQNLPHEVYVLP